MDNRIVVILSDEVSNSFQFDSNKLKDSEALHQLLCEIHPGDNYSVVFKNIERLCTCESGNCYHD